MTQTTQTLAMSMTSGQSEPQPVAPAYAGIVVSCLQEAHSPPAQLHGAAHSEGLVEYYWGDHIHLGYYTEAERKAGYKKKEFKAAKLDFVDEMLRFSAAKSPKRILDVGCGIGGSSRHLAAKFPDAEVVGKRRDHLTHPRTLPSYIPVASSASPVSLAGVVLLNLQQGSAIAHHVEAPFLLSAGPLSTFTHQSSWQPGTADAELA